MLREQGDFDEAIAPYTEAISLDSQNAEAYCGRASCYGKKSEFDKAITDCTEAIRINPENAKSYYGRGNSYWGIRSR
ncbi:MAG: tetratricopeptide repeat protein [Thermoguttaceae bacterium]